MWILEVLLDDHFIEQATVPIEEIPEDADMGFPSEDFNEGMISTLQGFQENEEVNEEASEDVEQCTTIEWLRNRMKKVQSRQ